MLLVVGYLLGGVPFGFVVSKAMGLPDPRTVGSKEVGLINVLRVSGRKAGILTLMGDMGKGWVMGFAATQLLQDEWAILFVALAPFLGYLFSPFLGFTSGKGVATALGLLLGVAPLIGRYLVVHLARGRRPLALFLRRCTHRLRALSSRCRTYSSQYGLRVLLCRGERPHCDEA